MLILSISTLKTIVLNDNRWPAPIFKKSFAMINKMVKVPPRKHSSKHVAEANPQPPRFPFRAYTNPPPRVCDTNGGNLICIFLVSFHFKGTLWQNYSCMYCILAKISSEHASSLFWRDNNICEQFILVRRKVRSA